MVRLTGNLATNAGVAVCGGTAIYFPTSVNATESTSAGSGTADTSNSSGVFQCLALAANKYDIRVNCGSAFRWIRYADEIQHATFQTGDGCSSGLEGNMYFGIGTDFGIRWSTADASNHAAVIGIGDTSQQIHITDLAAIATDWARSAGTHPELAIHSNTTPITDYLAIGNHNGTTASIDVVGGTTLALAIAGNTELTVTASGLNVPANSDILFTGTTGTNDINLIDSVADALSIVRGSTDVIVFNTSTPSVTITPATTITGLITATSGINLGTVAAAGGDCDKFLVLDSSGNVDYRTGAEVLSDIGGGTGGMTSFQLEDDDGTEVTISNAKEVKIIGSGVTTNWTDTDNGTDGDPYDLTITVDAAQTGITSLLATDIKIGEDDQTKIDFEDANTINFYANNAKEVVLAENALTPGTSDGTALGTTSLMWSDLFLASGGVVNFNAGDVLLTHSSNTLTMTGGALTVGVCGTGHDVKFFGCLAGAYMLYDESEETLEIRGSSANAATSTGKLLLTTAQTVVDACDVIGSINFQAPCEACGTDAIAVAASIQAVAQATFTNAVNNTDLLFMTGLSGAATEKFRFTAQGELGIGGANYGCDGQVLTSGGPGAAVAWEDAAGGASTALSNLASVAVNVSIISDTDSTDDLGSAAIAWANLYVDAIRTGTNQTLSIIPEDPGKINVGSGTLHANDWMRFENPTFVVSSADTGVFHFVPKVTEHGSGTGVVAGVLIEGVEIAVGCGEPSIVTSLRVNEPGGTICGSQIHEAWFRGGDGNGSRFDSGFHIGSSSDNSIFDISTHGSGTTTMYIGNNTIDVTSSDTRMKDNVRASTGTLARTRLLTLASQLRDYEWNNLSDWNGYAGTGLVAQELDAVMPEFVRKPTLGDDEVFDTASMWSVSYQYIAPYLIAEWKSHDDRLAVIERQLAA